METTSKVWIRDGTRSCCRMTQKPGMSSGVFLGITFVVILSNQGFKFTCRKKGHLQYHSSTLMLSGGQRRRWMCSSEVAWSTMGTLMVAVNFRGRLTRLHPVHNIARKASKWLHVLPGATNKSLGNILVRLCVTRNLVNVSEQFNTQSTPVYHLTLCTVVC